MVADFKVLSHQLSEKTKKTMKTTFMTAIVAAQVQTRYLPNTNKMYRAIQKVPVHP
jgi:hypothetical protein